MMTYRVYEDDLTNRARIHKAGCNRCNDGRGIKGERLPDNRWHGPYRSKQEAINRALETGRQDARGCWFCLRGVGRLR